MSRLFDLSTSWIVDHRWLTVLVLLVISGFAVQGYRDPHAVKQWFRARVQVQEEQAPVPAGTDRRRSDPPPDVNPVRLSDADAILVVESPQFFTPRGAEALRHVVARLEDLDYVDSILWMDRVPVLNIFGLPEPLLPRSDSSPKRFEAAREKALQHPLVGGQMLSDDGRTLLLLVHFDWFFVRSDEDCTRNLREVAERAAAEFPDVQLDFMVTGRAPMFVTAMKTREDNQLKYQIIGYGMVLLMSIILFRGVMAVIIVALAPSLGVFWTLGFLHYFDLAENPFNDVVLPVLLSMVGLTDGVHLMVQIRRDRAGGLSARDAARAGVREVGLACGLTSLTTAIGFGSLSLAHHDVVHEFGWSCVLGVLLTFVAVITVIPLVCSTWLGRQLHAGHDRGLIDRHLERIRVVVDAVLRHRRFAAGAGIVATLVLIGISLTLRPDERTSNALPMHSEASLALEKMDRALGGLEFSRVDIRWSDKVPSDSPEVLTAVAEVDELLRKEQLISHPLSIHGLVQALPGEGPASERMSMLELLPPPLKRSFYTPEEQHAVVRFRVQDLGIATYGPVFQRVEAGLADIARRHPNFSFELEGSAVWRWKNLYQIVVDLAASLGSASIIIFVVLAIVYRSARIGLISVVPNMFPLALTGTYLVFTGQALELVSVCAFTVCLGIAVDDTIHFLTRYQEERARGRDEQTAIRYAFTNVGTALIMTTVVLVCGFTTVLLSDSRDHRIFATMGIITLSAALFGDLVFLPALLATYGGERRATVPNHK